MLNCISLRLRAKESASVLPEAALALPLIALLAFAAIEFGLTHYFRSQLAYVAAFHAQRATEQLAFEQAPLDCSARALAIGAEAQNFASAKTSLRGAVFPAEILDSSRYIYPYVQVAGQAPQAGLFCMFFRCSAMLKVVSRVRIENSSLSCL